MIDHQKPLLSIIGPGNVGRSIAKAAFDAGYTIASVAGGRTADNGKKLADLVQSRYVDMSQAGKGSDLIFLAVPDNSIGQVCEQLCESGLLVSKPVVIHFSGALCDDILQPARKVGCSTASIHPLQTFPQSKVTDISGVWWFGQGDTLALTAAERLIAATNGHYHEIAKEMKPVYHAAAVICSNYISTLLAASFNLFQMTGLRAEDIPGAAGGLVRAAVMNSLTQGPGAALTGPVSRGDIPVIQIHLDALAEIDADCLELYKLLGLNTVQLAVSQNRIQPNTARDLIDMFRHDA